MDTQNSSPDHVKTVLIISSQVAASSVGSGASGFCLQRLGVNTVILPTTLFGQHPGWGAPGGGVIPAAQLSDMWEAIKTKGTRFDAVLCGYMGEPEHIDLAADIIQSVKSQNPDALVMVDPVMGDNGKLYIDPDIASAIIFKLLPLADYITPNMWEFSVIANKAITSVPEIYTAAKDMNAAVLVTSFAMKDTIGAILIEGGQAYLVQHARIDDVPHGGGDALAGIILGHMLSGESPRASMAKSVASIFKIFTGYEETVDSGELPLIRLQGSLHDADPLSLKRLKHD